MSRTRRITTTALQALQLFLLASITYGASVGTLHAETYIAGQAGYTIARDTARGRATDPENAGLPSGTSVAPIGLDNSLMYGMKVGHYFDSSPWLGVELEAFVTNPHRPQQQVRLSIPGSGTTTYDQPGATDRVVVLAPNLVARYQAGPIEPYIGIGPGLFFLHQHQQPLVAGAPAYSQSYTGVGLNTQVGVRYRVTDHLSLFGEWKYNYARINLPGQADVGQFGINAVVSLHHAVFGVGYHF